MSKKRFVQVGTGARGIGGYTVPLVRDFADEIDLVGLCDNSPTRMQYACKQAEKDIPGYTDFNQMIAEQKPDKVIVTTTDVMHDHYICEALKAGCDVITEKPMTIDAERCARILRTERQSGRRVRVCFNMRYVPHVVKFKQVLASGRIGKLLSVDLNWYLDTNHGASYFRRWHGRMEMCGGLWLHKSCHHLDMVNWLIGQEPVEIFAKGQLNFYGAQNGPFHGPRCRDCQYKDKCQFYWDITSSEGAIEMYMKAEEEGDHYVRDGCVWDPGINTYDTMSTLVKYGNGILLSYSLNAYLPYEGFRLAVNGTDGRVEMHALHNEPFAGARNYEEIFIYPRGGPQRAYSVAASPEVIRVMHQTGGHGGADTALNSHLFRDGQPDPLGQSAGSRAGAMAVVIGAGSNMSTKSGQPVYVKDLIPEEAPGF